MKNKIIAITASIFLIAAISTAVLFAQSNNTLKTETNIEETKTISVYQYPDFYRGIYLNINSSTSREKLTSFIKRAKEAHINCFVMDVQRGRKKTCAVPADLVKLCQDNGIHPIARIVVFPSGLKSYPVPDYLIEEKLQFAESACLNGFKEIQFDYIRFNDYKVMKQLTKQQKYAFLEGFLQKARQRVKPYDIKIAADVFGRIPLNHDDAIGQKMEVFDRAVDYICPMAYPSHYTWSNKLIDDPYYTVYITSKRGKDRLLNSQIVTYIQAFQIKVGRTGLSYATYLEEQIRAVHDAGVRGFLLWNNSQSYSTPFKVTKNFYENIYQPNTFFGSIKNPNRANPEMKKPEAQTTSKKVASNK